MHNVRIIIFGINAATSLYWVCNDIYKKHKTYKRREKVFSSKDSKII